MQDKYERIVDRLADREKREAGRSAIETLNKSDRQRRQSKALDKLEAKQEHELAISRYAEREFDRDPITEVPDSVKLSSVYFEDVKQRAEFNNYYADYYMQRFEDTGKRIYEDLSDRVRNCHKSWFGDKYKQSGYFNVKRVFHCKNRWCWLCNHLKQAKRLMEYTPQFAELQNQYDLYHFILTVKNVGDAALETTLNKMQNAFKKIIRYFQGYGKISGIDFLQYGFVGAIRSFEIVINPADYHPHIHALLFLKKDLRFVKSKTNKFSFDKGILKRKFSEFEVQLQKIFYLLMNGKRVDAENLDLVKLGYSVVLDLVEDGDDSWHEVFKYATKMSKDGAPACTYEQFCLLDDILHRFKMLQTYGIFYNPKNDESDEEPYDPTAEILFEKVLILLNRMEKPETDVHLLLEDICNEVSNKKLTVISKRLSYKYMEIIMNDLRKDLGASDGGNDPF